MNQVPDSKKAYIVKKKLFKRNENYENNNKDLLQEHIINDNLKGAKNFITHLDFK